MNGRLYFVNVGVAVAAMACAITPLRADTLEQQVQVCTGCHGENGKGRSPDNALFPVIGGQHKDYLVKQITDLKTGSRKNDPAGMMAGVAKAMTDSEIEAVAAYLAAQ